MNVSIGFLKVNSLVRLCFIVFLQSNFEETELYENNKEISLKFEAASKQSLS